MYYSYSSDMSSKILACQTTDPSATSLTCPNVSLANTTYFVIAAETTEGELTSESKSYSISISEVQNFSVVSLVAAADNIGNEVQGTGIRYIMSNQTVGYKLAETPQNSGTLKSITCSVGGTNAQRVKFALFTHDAVKNLPDSVVQDAITVEGKVPPTVSALTLDIESGTPAIVAGRQYWIVLESLDNWTLFGATWDAAAKIAYRDVTAYDWSPWQGTYSAVNPYSIGVCYFTYGYN